MLYGNIIFLKKTGGDGSKYPVTEKNIKIGRSEDCLIRIHNPQVSSEHCQLIVDDKGQVKLRNLSNLTILNGKPLDQGDVTLCHGDILKVGERLARWEYLPSSKYYKELLSPSGHLVAVVRLQQRSSESMSNSRMSTPRVPLSEGTPLGKRRFSERVTSENDSCNKVARISSTNKTHKAVSNVIKFLSNRHSFQGTKMLFSSKVKQKKSSIGVISSKTPKVQSKAKSRMSTLPSWKVNMLSPQTDQNINEPNTPGKKSHTPGKSNERLLKSLPKDLVKPSNLKTVVEIPSKQSDFNTLRSTRSSSKSPSLKRMSSVMSSSVLYATPEKRPKSVRQAKSETKSKSNFRNSRGLSKEMLNLFLLQNPNQNSDLLNLSVTLKTTDKNATKSALKKICDNLTEISSPRTSKNQSSGIFDSYVLIESPGKQLNKFGLVEQPQTPKSISLSSSPVKRSVGRPKSTPRKSILSNSVIEKTPQNLSTVQENLKPISLKSSSKKTPVKSSSIKSPVMSISKKTPARSASKKSINSIKKKTPQKGRPKNRESSLAKKSRTKGKSTSGENAQTSWMTSAERAANKLKTSNPRKPDKNKKAALLVLGKASRKQLLLQNVKVLLKQKIVKKAIKQSTKISNQKMSNKNNVKNAKISAAKKKKSTAINSSKVSKIKAKTPQKVEIQHTTSTKSAVNENVQENKKKTPKNKKNFSFRNSSAASETDVSLTENSPSKSVTKSTKKTEISNTNALPSNLSFEKTSPLEKPVRKFENYSFNTSRRCSKRLSSKNDISRPDFMELSPTALGLIPKNVEIFKTPKEIKRRSSSLSTPKNFQMTGIIKSASTSKIRNRKNVRFSSKDFSLNSASVSPNTTQDADLDLDSLQTPDITMDAFISPLQEKSFSDSKNDLNKLARILTFETEENLNVPASKSEKFARQLLQYSSQSGFTSVQSPRASPLRSPQSRNFKYISPNLKNIQSPNTPSSVVKEIQSDKKSPKASPLKFSKGKSPKRLSSSFKKSPRISERIKKVEALKVDKSPKNELNDLEGVSTLFSTPRCQKTTKNGLSLLRTPKETKSPNNCSANLYKDKEIIKNKRTQNSPKNDLSDLRGVKKLLKTPKVQKIPKNDLTDVRGVKKLLKTPKEQKSPKNDLTDIKGVKRLLKTPKVQRSPKNDLSDLRGVKKLLKTPKEQKSPKNDLTDVRGVKKLLKTPKEQKSPKNDLTDVKGVKRLLKTPKEQKSSKNDLSDLRGVKKLLKTPKVQKSPKNDLTDLSGVKQMFRTSRQQRSPKNNLSDLEGVQDLFQSPKLKNSTKNDLSCVLTVRNEVNSSGSQRSSKQNIVELTEFFDLSEDSSEQVVKKPKLLENLSSNLDNSVKQLLVAKSSSSVKSERSSSRARFSDLRSVRGRRTIYTTVKSPKNDLSDLMGVRELFIRNKPTSDLNVSFTGVAELFDLPASEFIKKTRSRQISIKEDTTEVKEKQKKQKVKEVENTDNEETIGLRGRLRKGTTEISSRSTRKTNVTEEPVVETEKKTIPKRKTTKEVENSPIKKVLRSKTQSVTKEVKKRGAKSQEKENKSSDESVTTLRNSRKRKMTSEVPSPPKLRRKVTEAKQPVPSKSKKTETPKRAISTRRQKGEEVQEKSTSVKKKISEKEKDIKKSVKTTSLRVQSKGTKKAASETGAKSISKVQKNRSQTVSDEAPNESLEKISPRKTRSVKKTTETAKNKLKVQIKSVGFKTVKAATKKKESPVVKRSTRRK